MRVWRLCKRRHAAFDGEGARLAGGRWNRAGTAVVYTSATLSLAAQELFVHLSEEQAPSDLVSIYADIPADLPITAIRIADLPKDWRTYPAPESLAELGTEWIQSGSSAVLEVPSAVIPQERNYLLNPVHRDFARIRLGEPEPFVFDPRVWKKV